MARADLHNAFAMDREIYEASRVDPSLRDPVVRVHGGVPGVARPFVVLREYQGPQGGYIEEFVLRDRNGRELVRSNPIRVELEGEMFENRFTTTIRNVYIAEPGELELTFYIDDDEVGTVPVFVETADGGDPGLAAEETFRSAVKKGTILWITVPAQPNGRRRAATKPHTQPVWFVYDQDKVYVFSGPTEQHVPGLDRAPTVELTARSKDMRSLVSRVTCDVEVVPPDDERWAKVGRTGLSKRLNLPDGDQALERWRQMCVLVELTPRFRRAEVERAAAAPAATAAAPAQQAAAAPAAQQPQEDIHVEAQVDQEVFDQLVAEGQPERVARAKAKAAYVRKEKARIMAEREKASA